MSSTPEAAQEVNMELRVTVRCNGGHVSKVLIHDPRPGMHGKCPIAGCKEPAFVQGQSLDEKSKVSFKLKTNQNSSKQERP